MKQTLIRCFALPVLLALCLMTACGGTDVAPRIILESHVVVFDSDGGTMTVELQANCPWNAVIPADAFFTLTPSSGIGDETLTIKVPKWKDFFDEWGFIMDERAFVLVFTGNSEDRLVESRLTIRQTVPPGRVSITDVRCKDLITYKNLPKGKLTPFRGEGWVTVEALNDWSMTCDPPIEQLLIDRWWRGSSEWYFVYPSNISGETIEYKIKASCQTASGTGVDSIVLVQPPSEGSMQITGISSSNDGKTIPASGADLYLKVKANTLWQVMTDADLYYSGLGYDNEDEVVVHVPSFEESGGRTIRLWLRLSELVDTNFIELEQR